MSYGRADYYESLQYQKGFISMEKDLQSLKKTWLKFVQTGEIDTGIETHIADSWKRSRLYGIDPINGGIGKKANQEFIEHIINENARLIATAKPIMLSIFNAISDINAIWLTSGEGYILEVLGLKEYEQMMSEKNIISGVRWLEEDIGTNAIALCLILGRPIQTVGAEHYCESHQQNVCSAAPIHDENGAIRGCLNISCNYNKFSNHILSAAIMGAYSIEKQIEVLHAYDIIDKTFDTISDGILIMDQNLKLIKINESANKILDSEDSILGLNMQAILMDIDFESLMKDNEAIHNRRTCFYIKNRKIHCIVSIYPIQSVGKDNNIAIVFNEEKKINKMVVELTGYKAVYTFDNIITQNEKMENVVKNAIKMSTKSCNLLITGDSGTGKELFAQAIHNESKRADGPFIAVNCGAIPRELVESELFGYEKGAFTGAAIEGMPGKFELANGGTLFLDEIGEMPIEIQTKLLRVLDDHKITRIGSKHEKELDVRLITATNRDLVREVEEKNFRMDLYYRLNVVNLRIPSLDERREDIRLLSNYFLQKLEKEESMHIKSLDEEVIQVLEGLEWKGNVRQLQNMISRLYYYCDGDTITPKDFPEEITERITDGQLLSVAPFEIVQKKMIQEAIKKNNGNITKAAKDLKISKATIYRKIEKYGIRSD